VVDTSAIMTILYDEPGADELLTHLTSADERVISAGTLLELGIVLEARLGPAARSVMDRFLTDAHIGIVPVDRLQVDRALDGWRRFGKGHHPAALNLGDCFAYGLADSIAGTVMCVGDDFAATDVEVLRPRGTGGSAARSR
jgi:ribonuclease VapC